MRISLKILGLLWLGLFLIIGALLYNAYSKLSPDTFIALLTEQVQKNYPGAKLDVGKISYRFSLDFNLNLQNIHLRRQDKMLGSIGEVELKVPWWLLLFNRGNAHINLKDLDIYVDHNQVKPKPSGTKTESKASGDEVIKISLPSYLSDAKFTLRAKNIAILDIDNARRYFMLSKLLVREFQYGKNSAFELKIPITITQNSNQSLSELWLFGDVTPDPSEWRLNFRGEFKTKETNDKFQIEDVIIGGDARFLPRELKVNSQIKLEIEKQAVGSGEFSADQDSVLASFNFDKLPIHYFNVFYEQIENPYLTALKGDAKGNIIFKKGFEKANAELEGKFNFDGVFQLNPKDSIPGSWQISFQDSRWEVSFMSPKGETSFFRRSFVDLKKNIVTQYVEKLGFSDQDLSLVISPLESLVFFSEREQGPYYSSTISYKNCSMGDHVLNGSFKLGRSPSQNFYQGQLGDEKSKMDFHYAEKAAQKNLDISFTNFNWNTSYQMLSPVFTAEAGVLNGKAEGKWIGSWIDGVWLVQLKINNLVNPKGKFAEFVNQSFSFFNVNPEAYPNQNFNISSKDHVVNLNTIQVEQDTGFKLSGVLSTKQKSTLQLIELKNKKARPVKKEVIAPYWLEKESL